MLSLPQKTDMFNKKTIIWIAILIPLGLLVLFYPNISELWNRHRTDLLTTNYNETVQEITDATMQKDLEAAQAYNQSLLGTQVPDSFLEREGVRDPLYESILNPMGNGMMGQVEIPCIDVRLPIYHYTDEETLQKGAGHLPGSSFPIGGDGCHSVITAHRGLPNAKMFTDLDRLREGNLFYITILGEKLAYQVDQILIVDPSDTRALSTKSGSDYCTLMTCTPYAVNSHRLLVRGHRVEYEESTYREPVQAAAAPQTDQLIIRGLCVLGGLAIAGLAALIYDRIKKRKHG